MNYANTLKKKSTGTLRKIRSCQQINMTSEILPSDIRILLQCNHSCESQSSIAHQMQKQQILERYKLFDPQRYFGNASVSYSQQKTSRLDQMFEAQTRINSKNSTSRKKSLVRVSNSMKGKSPQRFVKQNKQNYVHNSVNNMQKMRVKLKLGKKQ